MPAFVLPLFLLGSTITCSMLAIRPLWLWFNLNKRLRRSYPYLLFQHYTNFISRLAGPRLIKQAKIRIRPFRVFSHISPEQLIAYKTLCLILGGCLAVPLGIVNAVTTAVFGFMLPELVLKTRLRNWRKAFRTQFPFAVDLLTLIVGSGTGLQQALEEVAGSIPPGPLRDELWRALGHMALGASLREAFEELADRSGLDEVKAFVAAIVQAQQLGTKVESVLTVLVNNMRERKSQETEERSQLLPMKMLIPLLFFIFPALLIVLFAPFVVSGYLIF